MMHLMNNKGKNSTFVKKKMLVAVGVLTAAVVSVSCGKNTDPVETGLQENTNQTEISDYSKESSAVIKESTTGSTKEEETKENGIQLVLTTEIQTETNETETTTSEETSETTDETVQESESEGIPEISPKETQAVYDGTKEDSFFANSVFVGDSVMMGFRNYILKQEDGFLGNPEFLVSGSYSLWNALNPVSEKTIHPVYQGEQRMIWDSMALMGVDKAFLLFGLNDIGMLSVDVTYENYLKVFDAIYEVNPEISIYVLSTTNIYSGSEVGTLNNENVRLLNQKVRNHCENSKEEFIDITDYLIDENGYLKEEYCSDQYVHQTPAAYNIWVQVLREFASSHQGEQIEEVDEFELPAE